MKTFIKSVSERIIMKRALPLILILSLFLAGCTQPECETASDCPPKTGIVERQSCIGEWTCQEGECIYECAESRECTTKEDCEKIPVAYQCAGEWVCVEGLCEYECEPGECMLDSECEDKECEEDFECDKEPVKKCLKGHCFCFCESALELHEWGVIVGCTTNDNAVVTSRPEEIDINPYPIAVKEPVIYIHSEGKTIVDVEIEFTGTPTDTYPEAKVEEKKITWNDVVVDGCGEKIKGIQTEGRVPLESILDILNDVDADCLTYNNTENNFLFYEGMMNFQSNINITTKGNDVWLKNNREKPIYEAKIIPGTMGQNQETEEILIFDFGQVEPGEEKKGEMKNITTTSILSSELQEIGFTKKEGESFQKVWETDFFKTKENKIYNMIFRLDQEEYDQLFPLTVTPKPEKTIRAMYVFLEQDSHTMYKPPAKIAQDKSICAASGIQLVNYTELYENIEQADGNLNVKYYGNTMTCEIGELSNADATCPISIYESEDKIRVNVTQTECKIAPEAQE